MKSGRFYAFRELSLIGADAGERIPHLVDVLLLLLHDLGIAVIFRAMNAVGPEARVELVFENAFGQRTNALDGLNLRLHARNLLLHLAPGRIARLEGFDLNRRVVEQKLLDEIGDAFDLLDVKGESLPHGCARPIRIELGAPRIRVDDGIEVAQEGAVVLPLKRLDCAALAPLFIQETVPGLRLEFP